MLVICCGMKRSGSTLQYNIVKEILALDKDPKVIGHIGNDRKICETTSDISRKRNIVVKTHRPDIERITSTVNEKVKFTYTYRDVRNVAVSMNRMQNLNTKELIDEIDKCVEYYRKVREKNILKQRYEDELFEKKECISLVANYLEKNIDCKETKRVAHNVFKATRGKNEINKYLDYVKRDLVRKYRNIPGWIRHIFPSRELLSLANSMGLRIVKPEKETQIHPAHVSDKPFDDQKWKNKLTDKEIKILNNRYKDYLLECKYV